MRSEMKAPLLNLKFAMCALLLMSTVAGCTAAVDGGISAEVQQPTLGSNSGLDAGAGDDGPDVTMPPISGGGTGSNPGTGSGTGSTGGTGTGTGSGGPTPTPPPVSGVTPTTTTLPTAPAGCDSIPSGRSAGSIQINNGASLTKSAQVTLQLFSFEASEMKISDNGTCGCGTWEPYSTSKAYTLKTLNQASQVSVQYKDLDGAISDCATAMISHDGLAPVVTILPNPDNKYLNGDSSKFNLYVSEPGSGVQSITCSFVGGASLPCSLSASGVATITTPAQGLGSYSLSVSVTDTAGNVTTKTAQYTIRERYRDITQKVEIVSQNKVDILFVIDNSGSMSYEQKSMASRVSNFMKYTAGLDYRIAATSTDPRAAVAWGDGQLLQMAGTNSFVLDNSVPQTNAQTILGNTLQRAEVGSGSEQGIYATYRTVERSLDPATATPQRNFFRNDAAFAVIEITDEDESASAEKNIPANLNSFIKTTWPNKTFVFNSIITKPGDQACLDGEGQTFANVVAQMSNLTGGLIGSVCEADYATQLADLAKGIQRLVKTVSLGCAPIGDATRSVIVLMNGNNYTAPYTVKNDKIEFQAPLPVGNYEFKYQCAPL